MKHFFPILFRPSNLCWPHARQDTTGSTNSIFADLCVGMKVRAGLQPLRNLRASSGHARSCTSYTHTDATFTHSHLHALCRVPFDADQNGEIDEDEESQVDKDAALRCCDACCASQMPMTAGR